MKKIDWRLIAAAFVAGACDRASTDGTATSARETAVLDASATTDAAGGATPSRPIPVDAGAGYVPSLLELAASAQDGGLPVQLGQSRNSCSGSLSGGGLGSLGKREPAGPKKAR